MDIDDYEDFEEIHVKDVYIVDVFSDPTPVVLLENIEGEMLPIYIGHLEALSIGNVLKNISPPRPMAHVITSYSIHYTKLYDVSRRLGPSRNFFSRTRYGLVGGRYPPLLDGNAFSRVSSRGIFRRNVAATSRAA